eukprot:TRINITY_DN13743_c0_g1_i1.p1 TRINITY_DN13743_c0_g1~~TRINITY_DN13743_c0_g1_i1.p1  ORF type:complete len:1129 (+),score=253.48 TRINITY_DN13743_c0_g1_i1:26-3388(+)
MPSGAGRQQRLLAAWAAVADPALPDELLDSGGLDDAERASRAELREAMLAGFAVQRAAAIPADMLDPADAAVLQGPLSQEIPISQGAGSGWTRCAEAASDLTGGDSGPPPPTAVSAHPADDPEALRACAERVEADGSSAAHEEMELFGQLSRECATLKETAQAAETAMAAQAAALREAHGTIANLVAERDAARGESEELRQLLLATRALGQAEGATRPADRAPWEVAAGAGPARALQRPSGSPRQHRKLVRMLESASGVLRIAKAAVAVAAERTEHASQQAECARALRHKVKHAHRKSNALQREARDAREAAAAEQRSTAAARADLSYMQELFPAPGPLPEQPYVYNAAKGRLGRGSYSPVVAVTDAQGVELAAKLLILRSREYLYLPGREAFAASLLSGFGNAAGLVDIVPAADIVGLPHGALTEAVEAHEPLPGELVHVEEGGQLVAAAVSGVVHDADVAVELRLLDGTSRRVPPRAIYRHSAETHVLGLIMPLFSSGTLHDMARCTPPETARMLCDIGGALRRLKFFGLAHCDLHTKNIFVRRHDGVVRFALGDFGRAAPSSMALIDVDAWSLILCGACTTGMVVTWDNDSEGCIPASKWLDPDHVVFGRIVRWYAGLAQQTGSAEVIDAMLNTLDGVMVRTQDGECDDPYAPLDRLRSTTFAQHPKRWALRPPQRQDPLRAGDRVRARESEGEQWRHGTVTAAGVAATKVRLDGEFKPRVFRLVELSGNLSAGAAVRICHTPAGPWKAGTVHLMVGNRPKVMANGARAAAFFNYVEPVSAGGLGVGDEARVRHSTKEQWRTGAVVAVCNGKARVQLHNPEPGGAPVVHAFKYIEKRRGEDQRARSPQGKKGDSVAGKGKHKVPRPREVAAVADAAVVEDPQCGPGTARESRPPRSPVRRRSRPPADIHGSPVAAAVTGTFFTEGLEVSPEAGPDGAVGSTVLSDEPPPEGGCWVDRGEATATPAGERLPHPPQGPERPHPPQDPNKDRSEALLDADWEHRRRMRESFLEGRDGDAPLEQLPRWLADSHVGDTECAADELLHAFRRGQTARDATRSVPRELSDDPALPSAERLRRERLRTKFLEGRRVMKERMAAFEQLLPDGDSAEGCGTKGDTLA